MTPTFAVVVPAYQAAGTIRRCLQSVADQSLVPSQVIVIDDHSGDDTAAIAADYHHLLAGRGIDLRVIRQPANAGPSAARNVGIMQALATHVAFLDSDDVWHSRKLEVVRAHLGANPGAAMLFHTYTDRPAFGDPEPRPDDYLVARVRLRDLLWRNSAQTSCVVLRRDCPERFDERVRYCEDHDLWLRIAESHEIIRILGPALTRLGRPQLAEGGLSGSQHRMRAGEMRAYLNFCSRRWFPRIALLPLLLALSVVKHGVSTLRRGPRLMDSPGP